MPVEAIVMGVYQFLGGENPIVKGKIEKKKSEKKIGRGEKKKTMNERLLFKVVEIVPIFLDGASVCLL